MELSSIKEFETFVAKVVQPSILDIESLGDASRKHIQKLLYTNIVDRFDNTIDQLFLDNCLDPMLHDYALKGAEEPITQAQLYRLLVSTINIESAVKERFEAGIRQNILRENHSQKVRSFLRICVAESNGHLDKPRVKFEGEIVDVFKPQKGSKMPPSIVGYADWLYSRRNSIVHGSGTSSFLSSDKSRLKKIFKVDVTTSKISLSSCKTAVKFYTSFFDLVKTNIV